MELHLPLLYACCCSRMLILWTAPYGVRPATEKRSEGERGSLCTIEERFRPVGLCWHSLFRSC